MGCPGFGELGLAWGLAQTLLRPLASTDDASPLPSSLPTLTLPTLPSLALVT